MGFRKFLVSKNVKVNRERGASRISIETLLSHSTENLRRGNLCFRKLLVSKNVKDKREGGHHDFPSKLCCLTVPKNFAGETCVSENFWYRKMLRIREREGGITTLHRKFFCLNTEKLRRGNLCFRKVLVSQNFMDERGGREFHDFMLENFCLTVPKIFVEEPICVAENFWYREKSRRSERERERGGHHDFPSKICCLTVPSNFVGETCVSENFWYRKMLRIRERGGHHDFLSKIRCLTVPKNFVGETCVSERFWYRKIFWMRRGAREYHDFQMEIFCLTEPKNFVQEPFCVAEISGMEKCQEERERGEHHDFP